MDEKNYPTYRLRVSAELMSALRAAGPQAVKAVLERIYLHPVAQKPVVPDPVVQPDSPPAPVRSWRERIQDDVARIAQSKAHKPDPTLTRAAERKAANP